MSQNEHGIYKSISDCPRPLITCKFDYNPDYSPIIVLFVIVLIIFVIFPYTVKLMNIAFFSKIIEGKNLGKIILKKKEKELILKSETKVLDEEKVRKMIEKLLESNNLSEGLYTKIEGGDNDIHMTPEISNLMLFSPEKISPIKSSINNDSGLKGLGGSWLLSSGRKKEVYNRKSTGGRKSERGKKVRVRKVLNKKSLERKVSAFDPGKVNEEEPKDVKIN